MRKTEPVNVVEVGSTVEGAEADEAEEEASDGLREAEGAAATVAGADADKAAEEEAAKGVEEREKEEVNDEAGAGGRRLVAVEVEEERPAGAEAVRLRSSWANCSISWSVPSASESTSDKQQRRFRVIHSGDYTSRAQRRKKAYH